MSYTLIFCKYTGSFLDRSFAPSGDTRELFYSGVVVVGEYIRDVDGKEYLIKKIVHDIKEGKVFLYVLEV